ncbi:MAG: ROK family protein [Geodermatophilaceae bacterium]|nr:ROK family protein [Geodermatophilaceae bacterium]
MARAAEHGDPVALELLARSGRLVGGIVATVVNVFNPELIVVGGGAPAAGDVVLANIRQPSIPARCRLRRVTCESSGLPSRIFPGSTGAAYIDELFSRDVLKAWLPFGSPVARPDVVNA